MKNENKNKIMRNIAKGLGGIAFFVGGGFLGAVGLNEYYKAHEDEFKAEMDALAQKNYEEWLQEMEEFHKQLEELAKENANKKQQEEVTKYQTSIMEASADINTSTVNELGKKFSQLEALEEEIKLNAVLNEENKQSLTSVINKLQTNIYSTVALKSAEMKFGTGYVAANLLYQDDVTQNSRQCISFEDREAISRVESSQMQAVSFMDVNSLKYATKQDEQFEYIENNDTMANQIPYLAESFVEYAKQAIKESNTSEISYNAGEYTVVYTCNDPKEYVTSGEFSFTVDESGSLTSYKDTQVYRYNETTNQAVSFEIITKDEYIAERNQVLQLLETAKQNVANKDNELTR